MKRIGIHIGVNRINSAHYGTAFPVLRGAVNDAVAMQQALQPLGYTEQVLLTDHTATTDNLRTQLNRFSKPGPSQLKAGDLLVITYSGHGSQLVDSQRIESDKLDEVFVFWDRFLLDDELRRLLAEFANGVHVVVISDSCNSVTNIEIMMTMAQESIELNELSNTDSLIDVFEQIKSGEWEQGRLISWQTAMQVVSRNDAVYRSLLQQPQLPESALKATVLLLSACRDDQEAREMPNGQHGWFTFLLLNVFKNGLPLNYTVLRQRMEDLTEGHNQTPQLKVDGPNKPQLTNRKPFV